MPGIKQNIPGWAFVLAACLLVGIPFLFFWMVWPSESNPPAVPFQILLGFMPGVILAFLALMVGFVNKDAGRRGMSRTLWTLIVILVPNAIGFILYFLLRNPI